MGLVWGNYGDNMAKLRGKFYREMIDCRYKRAVMAITKTSHLFFVYIYPDQEIRRHHFHPITTAIHFDTAEKTLVCVVFGLKTVVFFHLGVTALTAHLDYIKFVHVLYLDLDK